MTEQPKKEAVESESSSTPDDGSNADASPVQKNKKRVSFGNLNEWIHVIVIIINIPIIILVMKNCCYYESSSLIPMCY